MTFPPPSEQGNDGRAPAAGPLAGVKVLDAGVLFAGPIIGTILADFGADVVKIEHPRGDPLRTLGWSKDGVSLWWAFANRNKECISVNLSTEAGQGLLRELVADADVLIESFRPGTLERWGLGYEELAAINPKLILTRVSGFGQTGPYSPRPGFGTAAEAMSGFAHINGYPDGPPTLPSFALGDGVCALFGAIATLMALFHRVNRGGTGQVVDVSIFEPLFWLLGPQAIVYDQLGVVQGRTGNHTDWTSPRNVYRSRDERWLALSASSQSIAERVMNLIGRPDLLEKEWFQDHAGRLAHQDELDESIESWIGSRSEAEVLAAFEEFEAVIAPVYTIADIFVDPQYAARETITEVEHETLGQVRVQNVVPRLSETPGAVRHLGRRIGEDNHRILVGQLGHTDDELEQWIADGVVGTSQEHVETSSPVALEER